MLLATLFISDSKIQNKTKITCRTLQFYFKSMLSIYCNSNCCDMLCKGLFDRVVPLRSWPSIAAGILKELKREKGPQMSALRLLGLDFTCYCDGLKAFHPHF